MSVLLLLGQIHIPTVGRADKLAQASRAVHEDNGTNIIDWPHLWSILCGQYPNHYNLYSKKLLSQE